MFSVKKNTKNNIFNFIQKLFVRNSGEQSSALKINEKLFGFPPLQIPSKENDISEKIFGEMFSEIKKYLG